MLIVGLTACGGDDDASTNTDVEDAVEDAVDEVEDTVDEVTMKSKIRLMK